MRARNETLTLTCTLLLALASCGGDKTQSSAPAAQPAAQTAQPSPAAQPSVVPVPVAPPSNEPAKPGADGVVRLTGSDQMRFSATRIEVKSGLKVKIELRNVGALPKEVMGHDLVVLKPGTDMTAFAARAMGAKATDYIPTDAAEVLAHTRLLGPGEGETIEFDVPGPGSYPFMCTFPGHVGLMNGQLVVE